MSEKPLACRRCKNDMLREPGRLDLAKAGDGPNACDGKFRGIFVELHRCAKCTAQAVRPVELEFSSPRLAAVS